MLKVCVGHSNDPDSEGAISEVLDRCAKQLGEVSPQAGILLAAVDFDYAHLLAEIDRAYPGLELIGGTTDGEISSVMGFEQDSIALILFASDSVTIRAGIGTNVSKNEATACEAAVSMALGDRSLDDIAFAIVLPESLTTSAAAILRPLERALGEQVPLFGGLTADRWQFERTYQFYKTEFHSDAVPILMFSGAIAFGYGVSSGWKPIGNPGTVTRVSENVVHEIDDRPAAEFYRNYLGDRPPSSDYPLAIYETDSKNFFLRAPVGNDPVDSKSVTFFGDIPNGATVQLTEASRTEILSASEQSVSQAIERFPDTATLKGALYFSCASRRQILGSRTGE